MGQYDNVECKRCGNRWYSDKFDEKEELPESCVRCYQSSVREIPPPPTFWDKLEERKNELQEEIPRRIAERKHQLILWKENNKLLISMAATGTAIIGLITVMTYFLFFM